MRRRDVLVGAAGAALTGAQAPRPRPIVIAHRGASGERPEHTMAAYIRAIEQGADFIEPDLVLTRDGVLVCRHENEIGGTTDVAARPEFASRRTTKRLDGERIEGWFAEDFTLAELRTLRCRERLPELRPVNVAFDGQEAIPTFAEVLALAQERGVGVYPELKHPTFLNVETQRQVEVVFAATVHNEGWASRRAPIIVQCFEKGALQFLRELVPVRRVQLLSLDGGPADQPALSYAEMAANLQTVASYADGVGVEKTMIIPRDEAGRSELPTQLVERAHAAGLFVHAWTFRAENTFLPLELRRGGDPRTHGDLHAELRAFYQVGVDGVFSDFPAAAVAARF